MTLIFLQEACRKIKKLFKIVIVAGALLVLWIAYTTWSGEEVSIESAVDKATEAYEEGKESIEKVKDAFHQRHEELYTYSELQSPVELVNIESTLYGRIDRPAPAEIENDTLLKDAVKSYRNLIFSNSGESIKTPVYDGNLLSDGHQIDGPAVIEEDTCLLYTSDAADE